jgi:hypothetical protein
MGIVASLAAAPVTIEILRDEVRARKERRADAKYGKYRSGDADLAAIKRLTMLEHNSAAGHAHNHAHGRVSVLHSASIASSCSPRTHKDAEVKKIYLGDSVYRDKYKYIAGKMEKTGIVASAMVPAISNGGSAVRKVRSAYPTVRFA